MGEIFELIVKHLNEGNYVYIGLFIAIIVIFRARVITDYWIDLRNANSRNLQDAITKIDDANVKKFLQNKLIEAEFFKIIKIQVEINFIKKLIELHEEMKGEYKFNYLIRASKYMVIENNELTIKLTGSDRAGFFFAIILAPICVLAGFVLIFLLNFLTVNLSQGLFIWGMGILLIFIAVFLYLQTFPYQVAAELQKKNIIKSLVKAEAESQKKSS